MSEIQKMMHNGELYRSTDEEVMEFQKKCLDLLFEYNHTLPSNHKHKEELLKEMFGDIGEDCYIETPFYSNFGGRHCHFGKNVYANFGLTCVDDTHIYVGDYTMFGPNVILATAGHPILPELRIQSYQYNMPIHVGENCWIGAGVIVLPGITIGNNVVVGAGSIVTKDLPDNVIAVGNPCKVLRTVSEKDKEYYFKDRKINWEKLK